MCAMLLCSLSDGACVLVTLHYLEYTYDSSRTVAKTLEMLL